MRFLINDTFWRQPVEGNADNSVSSVPAGPIFFYSGNEGAIDLFAVNTGLMWESCEEFACLLIFAEHRYYGKTLPLGEHSYDNTQTLAYLSVEQALGDYANFLPQFKKAIGADSAKVITFGGSYGGMLSTWFRRNYPHIVDGAIAGSAPLLQFGSFDPRTYSAQCTKDFRDVSEDCANGIEKSWDIMLKLASTDSGLDLLNRVFQSCPGQELRNSSDVQNNLWPYIAEALSTLPMADYPYPASFLGEMPASPVTYACVHGGFSAHPSDEELMNSIAFVVGVFYNSTLTGGNNGVLTCNNYDSPNIASLGNPTPWAFQFCSELTLPAGQYGPPSDFFYPQPFNQTESTIGCEAQFPGIQVRPNWISQQFGTTESAYATASNIFFSNGALDPWLPGGIQNSLGDSLPAFIIAGGAHHLDLRSSNPADPPSVIECRNLERSYIRAWINGYGSPAEMSTSSSSSSSSLSTRSVILISVVSTLGLVALVFAVVYFLRRSKVAGELERDYNKI